MKYRVTTDPDKPCKRVVIVDAPNAKSAAKRGVLKTHSKKFGCELFPDNIGEIERVKDRGTVTHVVTVVPTSANGPAPLNGLLARFAWLRVEGVWFWCSCIVERIGA